MIIHADARRAFASGPNVVKLRRFQMYEVCLLRKTARQELLNFYIMVGHEARSVCLGAKSQFESIVSRMPPRITIRN